MTKCKLFQSVTYKIYSDREKSVRGLDENAVTIYEKNNNSEVNEKQGVFDNKRSKYNLLCLYLAAYRTPKEKTVVITHLYETITINQTIVRF